MPDLSTKRCQPCEGGTTPLDRAQAQKLVEQTPGWTIDDEGKFMVRTFQFDNFHQTMAFVNALAWVAHQEDHHPDLAVGYRRCQVTYSTHAIGGLSENDFICAAKINRLLG